MPLLFAENAFKPILVEKFDDSPEKSNGGNSLEIEDEDIESEQQLQSESKS